MRFSGDIAARIHFLPQFHLRYHFFLFAHTISTCLPSALRRTFYWILFGGTLFRWSSFTLHFVRQTIPPQPQNVALPFATIDFTIAGRQRVATRLFLLIQKEKGTQQTKQNKTKQNKTKRASPSDQKRKHRPSTSTQRGYTEVGQTYSVVFFYSNQY